MERIERIVFFGTPEFAVPTLDTLAAAGRRPYRIITQPDRPAGRGHSLRRPPVAVWAARHGVEVIQPKRVKEAGFLAQMASWESQLAVVVAFGQIFPGDLLRLPEHGCVNLHASLLPHYRGAAPIAAAIAAGETATGVSTMFMDEGLDSGPVLLQREIGIGPSETTGELSPRLAQLGAELMLETVEGLEAGRLEARPQDDNLASYAPRLKKDDGRVDWRLKSQELFDRLRAYDPWPGLTAQCRERQVKLVRGQPLTADLKAAAPGTYLGLHQGCVAVRCGADTVFGIEQLQRPGRRVVEAREFANGERLQVGEIFT